MPTIYGRSSIGKGCQIDDDVIIGYPCNREKQQEDNNEIAGAKIGSKSNLRSGGVIYSRVDMGSMIRTGHHYLVREDTTIGAGSLIGSGAIIDNDCQIGKNVSIQSMVYIPTGSIIGDKVFLGPRATLTNDMYPVRTGKNLQGPIIKRFASIGAGAIILPGVSVGEGAMVAAGSVVARNVPDWKLAIGTPARITKLKDNLKVKNKL